MQMMAEGKIIDVAVKKTSHSIHLPNQSRQTKNQEFPKHFHSFTDIIFQFEFRL
jgi:ubiquinone biosynthesis protein COQ9